MNKIPLLGEKFPRMEVQTTFGKKILPDDYEGKWFVLFSHPADFTPVCTTEFIAFAKKYRSFKLMNIELIGLSVDQNFSHIKWVEWIKEKFDIDIPFPIISDTGEYVSKKLGMIHSKGSNASTVRAVFVVDPWGLLRLMFYYPQEIGRNMDEILRAIKAMIVTDTYDVATPENWPENSLLKSNIILPPPTSIEQAEAFKKEESCYDWWFCYREWFNNFDEI